MNAKVEVYIPEWLVESLGEEKPYFSQEELFHILQTRHKEIAHILHSNPNLPSPRRWIISGLAAYIAVLPHKMVSRFLMESENREETHHLILKLLAEYHNAGEVLADEAKMIQGMGENPIIELGYRIVCAAQGERIYTIRNNVIEQLLHTSVDESIPASMVQAPEQGVVYCEFGETKLIGHEAFGFYTEDEHGNPEIEYADGFYVDQEVFPSSEVKVNSKGVTVDGYQILKELGLEKADHIRVLGFCFTGATDVNASNIANSGYHYAVFHIPLYQDAEGNLKEDESLSFLDLYDRHEKWWNEPDSYKQRDQAFNKLVRFAILTLLYSSCQTYRETVSDLDKAREKVKTAGTKKKAKRQQQAMRAVNRIFISPEPTKGIHSNHIEGRSVRTHYRKGYIRLQRIGKGRTERKLVWISPTMVNADSGEKPAIKSHVVK